MQMLLQQSAARHDGTGKLHVPGHLQRGIDAAGFAVVSILNCYYALVLTLQIGGTSSSMVFLELSLRFIVSVSTVLMKCNSCLMCLAETCAGCGGHGPQPARPCGLQSVS